MLEYIPMTEPMSRICVIWEKIMSDISLMMNGIWDIKQKWKLMTEKHLEKTFPARGGIRQTTEESRLPLNVWDLSTNIFRNTDLERCYHQKMRSTRKCLKFTEIQII